MFSDSRHELFLIIEMTKLLENNEHIVGKSWAIWSIIYPIFSVVIVVMSGDVVNPIFFITLMIFIEVLQGYPVGC